MGLQPTAGKCSHYAKITVILPFDECDAYDNTDAATRTECRRQVAECATVPECIRFVLGDMRDEFTNYGLIGGVIPVGEAE